MKKLNKIWLGIFTFLPLLFLVIYFVFLFGAIIANIDELQNNNGEFPIDFFQSIAWAFAFLLLAIIIKIGLMIYYVIHVSENVKNDNTKKIMWILILVFVGTIGSVIYYFMEIYPSKKNELEV
ncbi:MAG: PLDc N-terminal domain-containing protein [Flavobacteriaceae bacterium]|nr:PLDc N-terminal domain-containing protein [Flavobacteriaceae bacterium]